MASINSRCVFVVWCPVVVSSRHFVRFLYENYQPEIEFRDCDDLMEHLEREVSGYAESSIRDSYIACKDDVEVRTAFAKLYFYGNARA